MLNRTTSPASPRIGWAFPLGRMATVLIGSALIVLILAAGHLLAQPAAQPGKAAAPQVPAAPRQDAARQTNRPVTNNPLHDQDQAERQQILSSREWRETIHAFNEWLSVQTIYPAAEVKKIRAELNAKIARMSARQLRDFLEDSKEKMKILMSKEAEDARLWLAQRMAVEVRHTPEEIKESRPDVVRMTSAQLEANLRQIEAQRLQIRQTQKGFESGRKQQIKSMQHTEREGQREHEESLDRAAYDLDTPYGNFSNPL